MFEGCSEDFHCTNQGQSPVIDGVDDAKEMVNTRRAFSILGECQVQLNSSFVSALPDVIRICCYLCSFSS